MKIRTIDSVLIVSVILLAVCFGFAVSRFGVPSFSYNYTASGVLGQSAEVFFRVILSGIFIAYAISCYFWYRARKDKVAVPVVVLVSAIGGTAAGLALSFLIVLTPVYDVFARLGKAGGVLIGLVTLALPVVFLVSGIRAGVRIRVKKPVTVSGRLLLIMPGMVLIALLFSPVLNWVDFPGSHASAGKRHAWAVQKFGTFYSRGVDYLEASLPVSESLGSVTQVAPVSGLNRVISGPGEVVAIFTLDVAGKKAKGTAMIRCQTLAEEGYACDGDLLGPDSSVILPHKIMGRIDDDAVEGLLQEDDL